MFEMDCEVHDKQAAGSRFLTHAIGRILSEMKIESTSMNTKGLQMLLQLVIQRLHGSEQRTYLSGERIDQNLRSSIFGIWRNYYCVRNLQNIRGRLCSGYMNSTISNAFKGPVNFVSLHCVKSSMRPMAMAISTVSIHIFGDVPSSPLLVFSRTI